MKIYMYLVTDSQDEVCIQFNCAYSAFINNKQLLVCLKDGQTLVFIIFSNIFLYVKCRIYN